MKQLIVMIATILLGIAIAVLVMGFQDSARTLTTGANNKITNTFSSYIPSGN